MPLHLVLRLKVILKHAHCLIFRLFTSSWHSSDHCCNLLLLASCTWGTVFCYSSVKQVLISLSAYFRCCSFSVCLFDARALQKGSRTALLFLNFDLSQRTGLMCLGGGTLAPSSLSSLSSEDINSTALCTFNTAFILALSSKKEREIWALSNTS